MLGVGKQLQSEGFNIKELSSIYENHYDGCSKRDEQGDELGMAVDRELPSDPAPLSIFRLQGLAWLGEKSLDARVCSHTAPASCAYHESR